MSSTQKDVLKPVFKGFDINFNAITLTNDMNRAETLLSREESVLSRYIFRSYTYT